jgi:hypothetical protein
MDSKTCRYLFGIGMILWILIRISSPVWGDDSKGDMKISTAYEVVKVESISDDGEDNSLTEEKNFSAAASAAFAPITLSYIDKWRDKLPAGNWVNVNLNKPVLYTNDHHLNIQVLLDSYYELGTSTGSWYAQLVLPRGYVIRWNPFIWHRSSVQPPMGSYFIDPRGKITQGTRLWVNWLANVSWLPAGDATLELYYNGQVMKSYKITIKTGVDPSYITPYSQGDYKSEKIVENKTIAAIGCAMTSACMMLSYYGVNVNPKELNDWLKNVYKENPRKTQGADGSVIIKYDNGYTAGGNIKWGAIKEYARSRGLNLKFVDVISDQDLLDDGGYLGIFGPQILEVKWKPQKSKWGHWVTVHGWDTYPFINVGNGSSYCVADPEKGKVNLLLSSLGYSLGPNNRLSNRIKTFITTQFADGSQAPADHPVHFSIYLHSPAELLLTDSQGRRTGYDPVSGQTFEEIPGATYSVEADFDEETDELLDETKVLEIMEPGVGQFSLQVCGTGSGTYDMEIVGINKHLTSSGTSYQNVPITPNHVDTYRIQYDNTLENYEAETMALVNYVTESNPDTASGETLVKVAPLTPSGPTTGNVSFTYTGSSGRKDITVWYYDTTNGKAMYKIYVNDVPIDEWTADQNLGSSWALATRTSRVLNDIQLNSGDRIRIEGTTGDAEVATLDNVEVSPVVGVEQENPAAPALSPAGGIYDTAQNVTLSCPMDGAVIRYTTDGSTPTLESPLYHEPIAVTQTATIKAFASKTGLPDSLIASAEYKIQVLTPVFSLAEGDYDTAQSVAITCATDGAIIRYTTDGSNPDSSSPVYNGPLNIGSTTTLKAYATKTGLPDSEVATAAINIKTAMPEANPCEGIFDSAQTVALTCSTSGATIRYTTDGSVPNGSSPVYGDPISILQNTTIRAFASKAGLDDSDVLTATYEIQTPAPTFGLNEGCYTGSQNVALSCPDSEATIIYTTDGTNPRNSPTAQTYNSPITIATDTAVLAYATKAGMTDSDVVSSNYTIRYELETPICMPPGGDYIIEQEVFLACETSEATIKYTTDGSDPTTSATARIYSEPIAVTSSGTVIKAYATLSGFEDSEVNTQNYRIIVYPPAFSPPAGTYASPQTVGIRCDTEGAIIHYTTDGSTPTASSPVYSAPIAVDKTMIIKACAMKAGFMDSDMVTAFYSIESAPNSLTNPGFESGPGVGWTEYAADGHEVIDGTRPQTGSYSLRLGGYNNANDYAGQQVVVPANGVLTYCWYMASNVDAEDPYSYDFLNIQLYQSDGTLLTTLKTYSNASERNYWVPESVNLAFYAGQTVILRFECSTDESLPTAFWIDNVSITQ